MTLSWGASMRRGSNLPRVGDFNQAVILDTIRRSAEGLSRVELVEATGLSSQTVTNICRKLLGTGLITEAGKQSSGPGKPRTILRLQPAGRFALGVHLDPAVLTFVILDLVGNVVAHAQRPTPKVTDPDQVIAGMAETLHQLVDEADVPADRLLGLGIASPGPIDVVRGVVVDPPLLFGWRDVPLRAALNEATGLPVLLDKDVTAAAVAEMWAGGSGSGSFVFFYLGTGIGTGMVVRDSVLRGVSDNAGEIGHFLVDPTGPVCLCGRRGCVGGAAMPYRLVVEAVEAGVLDHVPNEEDASEVDRWFTVLCERAAAGDARAVAILDRSAVRVAKAATDVVNLLDLDRVVFGGPFWSRLEQRYLQVIPPLLEAEATMRNVHAVDVVGTSVGEDVGAIGAACLVLDNSLSPRPSSLLIGS
ncbi:ROK family transcriptional regulator [Phytoactinopolyspora mesophila]|uniref:ROK family protein n=1 Tax=Phytoactinopolyspora mesophila TaxID=2650750 RepID=A0A7K3LWV5_9ACTN|nr:ROK family transcriptional regulator [Phytoactinopolyspora mesophila]NDL55504.1 ROK family protein [Phytoactinopolyspora mesophila]